MATDNLDDFVSTPEMRGDVLESEAPVEEAPAEEVVAEAPTEEVVAEAPAEEVVAEAPTEEAAAPTEEAAAPTEEAAPPKDERHIPKARFDEVNERRKAAEARLAELEKTTTTTPEEAPPPFDYDAKEIAYINAALDGKPEEALAIRKEINVARDAEIRATVTAEVTAGRATTHAELSLNETISGLQSAFPELDGTSDVFNQDITDEALELYDVLATAPGTTPSAAMSKAVRYVTAQYGLSPAEGATVPVAPPAPAPASTTPPPGAVATKMAQAAQQPPAVAGRGAAPSIDITTISESDFDKLSAKEIAIARGDVA